MEPADELPRQRRHRGVVHPHGGYQALSPEKLIRYNQRWGWQPRWVRERATFTPNVLGARIAGAVGCIVGVGFLSKALAA
ncbi:MULTISPECIES: hypothetical protein [Dermacoccus]|uniref:hypothetical protein n=1 Tax=Dermacoccus TaxID=57495 RepID=UPI000AF4C63E|nr:hypothetical protein [Dermacoccus nishinomiyaensis]MCG7428908.1 hypothetical protein [Dermacoccus nishinomiyaensis]